jgi:hypothetical protein
MSRLKGVVGRLPQLVPETAIEALRGTAVGEFGKRMLDRFQSLESRTVRIETDDGTKTVAVQIPEGSFPWMEIDRIGVYEPALTRDLFETLTTESVFFDVGSHFGYYSQIALAAGVPPERIVSFEADQTRFRQLSQVHANDEVTLYQTFVGDGSGETVSLDTVAANTASPTVIKIDVEGSEAAVLDGMEAVLSTQPTLYIEFHPQTLPSHGASVTEIITDLQANGYTLYTTDHRETDRWTSVDLETVPTYDPDGKQYNNPDNTYLIKAVSE